MPDGLTPRGAERATGRAAALEPVEVGLMTGMLAGMVVGGVYGSLTYDGRCGSPEDGCTLARGMDTGVFAIVGGALGGLVGAGTSALLHRRRDRRPAPLTVEPGADGTMRVGVMLRP